MSQSDKEKIAIVLINRYKNMVDKFKKFHIKSGFAYIQIAETDLYGFTEDKPIARKFFEKVLEYRRKNTNEIEVIGIPIIIEADLATDTEITPTEAPAIERREPVAVVEKSEPKPAIEEEYPFEF